MTLKTISVGACSVRAVRKLNAQNRATIAWATARPDTRPESLLHTKQLRSVADYFSPSVNARRLPSRINIQLLIDFCANRVVSAHTLQFNLANAAN